LAAMVSMLPKVLDGLGVEVDGFSATFLGAGIREAADGRRLRWRVLDLASQFPRALVQRIGLWKSASRELERSVVEKGKRPAPLVIKRLEKTQRVAHLARGILHAALLIENDRDGVAHSSLEKSVTFRPRELDGTLEVGARLTHPPVHPERTPAGT